MKNLTPRRVRNITLIVELIAIIISLFGIIVEINLISTFGLIIAIGIVIFYLMFYRCHSCGKFLGRENAKYCPHCVSEVE